jgi:hypothetical protein
MTRIFHYLLFSTLILWACAPISSASKAAPRNQATTLPPPTDISIATTQAPPDSATPPTPKILLTLETPGIEQSPDIVTTVAPSNPQDCAYQWAYQDLPELSSSFLQSIQSLQPEAQANAFAFGENCVRADGSATFLAMETDFNVTLQAEDLSNESDLGEWIVRVMQVIQDIPADQIVGPRPGRVSIIFQSGAEQKAVNYYIDQYKSLPLSLSSEEIYNALQTQ